MNPNLHFTYIDIESYSMSGIKHATLSASVEISLFDEMSSLKKTNTEATAKILAKRLQVDEPILTALLQTLTSLNFCTHTPNHTFELTEKSTTFLLSESPFHVKYEFLTSNVSEIHERLITALKESHGPLLFEGESIGKMWEDGAINSNAAESFTWAMQRLTYYPAFHHSKNEVFATVKKLVDVGGGSGAWALALHEHHPKIQVEIFDLPEVVEVAKTVVKEMIGEKSTIQFQPGNFFTDSIPKSDAFLLSNILHDWTLPKCEEILKSIARAAEPGAKLFIHECILNEDKCGPEFTSLFNLLMAVNYRSQQFSHSELNQLLEKCGFSQAEKLGDVGHFSLLTCSKL